MSLSLLSAIHVIIIRIYLSATVKSVIMRFRFEINLIVLTTFSCSKICFRMKEAYRP